MSYSFTDFSLHNWSLQSFHKTQKTGGRSLLVVTWLSWTRKIPLSWWVTIPSLKEGQYLAYYGWDLHPQFWIYWIFGNIDSINNLKTVSDLPYKARRFSFGSLMKCLHFESYDSLRPSQCDSFLVYSGLAVFQSWEICCLSCFLRFSLIKKKTIFMLLEKKEKMLNADLRVFSHI